MKVRPPRRRLRSRLGEGPCGSNPMYMIRLLTLILGIGVGGCACLLMMQYSNLSDTMPAGAAMMTTSVSSSHSVAFPSVYEDRPRSPIVKEPLDDTEEKRAQREEAARQNQAWLQRKFAMAHQMADWVAASGEGHAQTNQNPVSDPDSDPDSDPVSDPVSDPDPPPEGASSLFRLPRWASTNVKQQIRWHDAQEQHVDPICHDYNHTILRPTHGCQVNPDTFLVYCAFSDLRIDTQFLHMKARGGEVLETVMGRPEEEEFPLYDKGGFAAPRKPHFDVPTKYRMNLHYMEDVLNHMRYPTKKNPQLDDKFTHCAETWTGTTLLVTRYEYVNLYHTLTDWWNAYSVLPPLSNDDAAGQQTKPKVRLLFLDGHAQGNLDPVWEQLFGPYTYVQQLPPGGVCLEHAIFIPPGYLSTLFPSHKMFSRLRCPLQRHADAFATHVLTRYGLQDVQPIPGKVVLIDRQPYASHPRSHPDKFARILLNLDQLQKALRQVPHVTSVDVVRFETMTFAEQLKAIRQAHVLIGNHGAGLSHVLFMDRRSHLVELMAGFRDFFGYLSEWKGVQHTPIELIDDVRMSESEILRTTTTVESIVASQPRA